jgi:dimeric dUTPase (all-alpha-NTP-PPase superfamily)
MVQMETIAVPDLHTLAEMQDKLDQKVTEKFNITEDTVNKRIIAFKVEFGEFLNEHKFFKFWKEKREPNRYTLEIKPTTGDPLQNFTFKNYDKDPLLEEYVDGIHFLLSIGNHRKYIKYIHAFHAMECDTENLEHLALLIFNNPINSSGKWLECFHHYLYFGHLVGISAEDIEQAYMLKNKINHDRQANGY